MPTNLTWAVYTVCIGCTALSGAMAWVSFFGLAAMSPTVAVSRPETLAHSLVFALVAYIADGLVPQLVEAGLVAVVVEAPYEVRPRRRISEDCGVKRRL